MNQIDMYTFQLIKKSMFPNDFMDEISFDESDLRNVYSEMRNQTIDALPEMWLKQYRNKDSKLIEDWLHGCMMGKLRWAQVMVAQNELLTLLDRYGIRCVILKGAAAGMAYPSPELRTMGDVDFLVARKDYEKTAGILESNGYQLIGSKIETSHHYEYIKNGVLFELHRRLANISEKDEELLSLFEEGIMRREIRTVNSFSFPVFPPDLNGLVLLLHINQHLRKGLGLRQIIDWMMFLNENGNVHDLQARIQKMGMEHFARTVTIMCQKYLGLNNVVEETEDYPYEELMDYILSLGNFGIKNEENSKISYVFFVVYNPIRLFKRLQNGGCLRWKAAKKYRILRPFAWIYQIGFIIHQLFKNKITPVKLYNLHKNGNKERELILKMGLDVDNTFNEK